MALCFIEPQEAIRVVAESVGREARRQLLGEVVAAWVDEIPDDELDVHYAKAVEERSPLNAATSRSPMRSLWSGSTVSAMS